MVGLALIPGLPLLGAILMLFFGARLPRAAVASICTGTVALSFIASIFMVVSTGASAELNLGPWLPMIDADWALLLDRLSAFMILVVTGVGFLVHWYAAEYMKHEGGYCRFFGYMNLFVFFMLLLVMANNYALMFVGWEGVGLSSYLLIGFYFNRHSATTAGSKAFLVNRIGDAGFILGILLMWATLSTVSFSGVQPALAGRPVETGFGVLSAIALLLFAGAAGKSAQFPLYVWLPDAMEGPTPVSALIHAATMVTAGVYLVARASPIFALAPQASVVLLIIGAITALMAATIATVQSDIKRVLAFSTVSQLGFMVMALGAGAYWVALFHLFTHAFFKALLFLGAGSVIHGAGGEQDMRRMGGLRHSMPWTYRTMLIGTLAIAGLPPLAGFFSKDEILLSLWVSPLSTRAVFFVALFTACLTAFYMLRMMRLTFFGTPNEDMHAHESPRTMLAPLFALAAGSIAAGWIRPWFHHALQPALPEPPGNYTETTIGLIVSGVAVTAAVAGIWLGRFEAPRAFAAVFRNGWYLDAIYDRLFVRGLGIGGGSVLDGIDRGVVDGGVNGAGWLTRASAAALSLWDRWVVDGAVRVISFLVALASYPARLMQTGRVQTYALVMAIAFFAMLSFYWSRA